METDVMNLLAIPERVDMLNDSQRFKTTAVLFAVGFGTRSIAQVMGMGEVGIRKTKRKMEEQKGEYYKASMELRSVPLSVLVRDYLLPNIELVRRIRELDPAAKAYVHNLSVRRELLGEHPDE